MYDRPRIATDSAHRPARLASLACWLSLLAGCGGNTDQSYVPASDSAREALTLALDAWKAGQPAEPVGKVASGATVRAIDSDWSTGRRLTSYEVVQELPQTEAAAPRQFAVKLTFEGTSQPVEATYLVVGIDPLQVFSRRDYDQYFGLGGK